MTMSKINNTNIKYSMQFCLFVSSLVCTKEKANKKLSGQKQRMDTKVFNEMQWSDSVTQSRQENSAKKP